MRQLRALFIRLAGLLHPRRAEDSLAEELEIHLAMHTEDGIRAGLSPAEARRQAILKLGGIEPTKERVRDRRGIPWLENLARDIATGIRMMRRRPAFTSAVVLTLALGIGATTAIFSVVSGVLLRPLPYPDASRLVYVATSFRGEAYSYFAYTADFASWKQNSRSLSGIAGYMQSRANFDARGESERVSFGFATESLFPLLGVRPVLGRTFLPEEDRPGAPFVALLDHAFWTRRFAANPSVIGTAINLDGQPHTIIGVLPPNFRIPDRFTSEWNYDLWVPFAISDTGKARTAMMHAIGRLKPGASREAARAELEGLTRTQLRKGLKNTVSVVPWQEQVSSGARNSLILFMSAVAFVLLIACVNVANLLLSRAASREKEIAVRRALGASQARILCQLLMESLLMAACGGALGLAFASLSKDLLVTLLTPRLPTLDPIHLDHRVLIFNVALVVLTSLMFGLAPAWQASKVQLEDSLKASSRGSSERRSSGRARDILVTAEVALAMILLTGAAFLFNSFLRLRGSGLGFRTDRVLTFDLNLTPKRYPTPPDQSGFLTRTLDTLRSLPGVESVAGGTCLPLTGATISFNDLRIEGHGSATFDINAVIVSPGYFRTMAIPVIGGREFTDLDRDGAPSVAIVNQSFAHRYLAGGPGLGRRIENPTRKDDWLSIVGITADVLTYPGERAEPQMYLSYLQPGDPNLRWSDGSSPLLSIVVRAARDPLKLIPAIRDRIANIDPTQPPYGFTTLDERRAQSIAPRRANTILIVAFASIAVALGAIGIYAVLAYSVGRRLQEIGVRLALGAHSTQILAMILRRGMLLVATGIAIGLCASLALTRLIASELWGITPADPWTYFAVIAILATTGLAACWLPARRATRVDPIRALRYE